MAKKVDKATLFDNAARLIKENLAKGEIGYATADGQAFYKSALEKDRKKHASRHAANFHPPLEIKEFKGEKEEEAPKAEPKRKAEEIIAEIEKAETVEAVEALLVDEERVTVKKAGETRIAQLQNSNEE